MIQGTNIRFLSDLYFRYICPPGIYTAYICKDMVKRIKYGILIYLCVGLVLCCTGCANLKDVRDICLKGFSIESLKVESLDNIQADIAATIYNPAKTIKVSLLEGTAYRKGKILGTFSSGPFTVEGRTESTPTLSCTMTLDPSAGPGTLLSVVSSGFDVRDYTVDIKLKARIGKGVSKRLSMKDVPLENIIGEFK